MNNATLAQILQEAEDNGLLETLTFILQRGDMADAWTSFLAGLRTAAEVEPAYLDVIGEKMRWLGIRVEAFRLEGRRKRDEILRRGNASRLYPLIHAHDPYGMSWSSWFDTNEKDRAYRYFAYRLYAAEPLSLNERINLRGAAWLLYTGQMRTKTRELPNRRMRQVRAAKELEDTQ